MAKRKRANAEGSTSGSKRKAKATAKVSVELPPPPVFPYTAEKGIPISEQKPNVELLEEPLSVKDSYALSHSLAQSRNKWLSGAMFTKFWTRPPRGRKLAEGEVNAREKMAKLCECLMAIGPHIFDVKLFIVKDESKDDLKDESKDDLKDESKDNSKDDSKEESKDDSKNDSKDDSREKSKEESKDESKDHSKDDSKAESKDTSKEVSKEDSKDATKEDSKDKSKDEVDKNLKEKDDDSKESLKTGENSNEINKTEGSETTEDKSKDSTLHITDAKNGKEKPMSDITTEQTISKSDTTEKSNTISQVEPNQPASPATSKMGTAPALSTTLSASIEKPQTNSFSAKPTVISASVQPSTSTSSKTLLQPKPPASSVSPHPSSNPTTDKSVHYNTTSSQPQKPINHLQRQDSPSQLPQQQTQSSQPQSSQSQPSQPQEGSTNDSKTPKPSTPSTTTVANNPNNMATIMKLQAIARIDRSLNSLMKIVASGNASPEQITAFQAYINRARSMELEDIPRFFKPVPDPGAPNASAALNPQQQPQVNQGQNPSDQKATGTVNPPSTLKGKSKKKDPSTPRKIGKPRGKTAVKHQKKSKSGTETKKKAPAKAKNSYIPKKLQKKVTIVFEFKDNPADRYIIPKNSIIEILPTNEVLISFLLLFPEGGIAVKSPNSKLPPGNIKTAPTPSKPDIKKEEVLEESTNADTTTLDNTIENEVKPSSDGDPSAPPTDSLVALKAEEEDYGDKATCYYPLTVTIRNMPVKSLPILERSVNKPAAVAEYMEKTMAERVRAKNWWVWFQIDRRDQELLGKLIQPAKPPENMFIPARVRVYKSKKKSKEDAEKKKKKGKKDDDDNDDDDDNAFGSAAVDEESGARSDDDDDNKAGEGKGEVMDMDPAPLSKDDTTEPTVSESKPDVTMTDAPTVSPKESFKSATAKLEAEVVDFDAMEH